MPRVPLRICRIPASSRAAGDGLCAAVARADEFVGVVPSRILSPGRWKIERLETLLPAEPISAPGQANVAASVSPGGQRRCRGRLFRTRSAVVSSGPAAAAAAHRRYARRPRCLATPALMARGKSVSIRRFSTCRRQNAGGLLLRQILRPRARPAAQKTVTGRRVTCRIRQNRTRTSAHR